MLGNPTRVCFALLLGGQHAASWTDFQSSNPRKLELEEAP